MSKLAEYRQLEKHLAEQLQALEALKSDGALKKEIEFETKLRERQLRTGSTSGYASHAEGVAKAARL